MTTLFQDLRFALRMMGKSPVVSAVAVLSLSVGIAANTGMFAILNSFLLEPLPYADQDELVLFRSGRTGESLEMASGVSFPDFTDLMEAGEAVEDATLYSLERANLTGRDIPESLQVVVSSPNLFDVLGVAPAFGRGFRPEEGVEGAGNVLVLEHDYWERRFFSDPDVLGTTVLLDGVTYTIVGVMPAEFDMIPADVQAFRPSDFREAAEDRGRRAFIAIGRLGPGATLDQLLAQLAPVSARLQAEFPDTHRGWESKVMPLRKWFPGPTDSQLLKILTAVTLFGLLIACANVANLLLSRAEERQKEVSVRTALGAGRSRILRQLLTESIAMGTIAGGLGIVMSIWLVRWMRTAMPALMPVAFWPRLDPEVLVATLAVSILAGVAFGLAPSLHAARTNLSESLGTGGRGGTDGRRRKRMRNVFVVGEIAAALALLSGAGLLIQAFDRLANDDQGFEADGLLAFGLNILEDRTEDEAALVLYQEEIVRSLEAIPGVAGVALMSSLPRSRGNPAARYTIDGRPEIDPNERPIAGTQVVNPGYFETMRVPLVQGRGFSAADRAEAAPVALVSQAFVAREFSNQDPIGQRVTVDEVSREIVGVVGNVFQERMPMAGNDGEAIYLPLAQAPRTAPFFTIRTGGDPTALAADVRQAVWDVEPDQPIAQLRSLQAHIDEELAGPQVIGTFLLGMGLIALILAAMGIYGVMAHGVAQQQREIGIRMALGADRGKVVGMVARGGMSLVGVGILLGLPLSAAMFWMSGVALNLFETNVDITYPLALGGALVVVAAAATFIPAARASAVAPVSALKE